MGIIKMFTGLRNLNKSCLFSQARRAFSMQQALVLEEKGKLALRDIDFPE